MGKFAANKCRRFRTSLRIQNNTSRYTPSQSAEVINAQSYVSTPRHAPGRAQGHLYHLPLPDYLSEPTGLHNTLSPDVRRPSVRSTHAVL
jgi:hypothetical protein